MDIRETMREEAEREARKKEGLAFVSDMRKEAERGRGALTGIRAGITTTNANREPIGPGESAFIKDLRKGHEKRAFKIDGKINKAVNSRTEESRERAEREAIRVLQNGAGEEPGAAGRERLEGLDSLIKERSRGSEQKPGGRDVDGPFDRYNSEREFLRGLRE